MPSLTAATAFIDLYYNPIFPGAPWNFPRWKDISNVQHGLFSNNDQLLPKGINRQQSDSIQSYFHQYKILDMNKNKAKFSSSDDKKKALHDKIIRAFTTCGVHPLTIFVAEGMDQWPNADTYIPAAVETIAIELFGLDTFSSNDHLHSQIRRSIQTFAQRSWLRIPVKAKRDQHDMRKLENEAIKAFKDLDQDDVTKGKIIQTMRAVAKWKEIADTYNTKSNQEKAAEMIGEIERLLENIGIKGAGEPKTRRTGPQRRLFRNNCTLFINMATEKDLEEFSLNDIESGDMGMEKEYNLDPNTLAVNIGFTRDNLPHQFISAHHVMGKNAWDQPELFVTKPNPDYLVENRLHWHQIVGVHSMARKIFTPTSDPDHCCGILICDEVGPGKTSLTIAIIAFLNQSISMQQRGQLPPVLADCKYLNGHDTIPGLPHLIVAPGTLRGQWIKELKSMFLPRSVDILVYECPRKGNPDFWSVSGPILKSVHEPQNIIVVTSHSSLQNEYQQLYKSRPERGKRSWELPNQKSSATTYDRTLFSQDWLTVSLDEAHEMRSIGVKYYSAFALFKQAVVKMTLTGTPLQTSPRDISALGQLIGLKSFMMEEFHNQEKDDNAAICQAKKYDDNGESVRKAQIKAVRKMHRMFAGHILHRVPDSKDWEGKKLLDIPPYKDIIGILMLTERENEILKDRAEMARTWYDDCACCIIQAKENITSVLSANETGKLQTKKFYYEYQSAVSYAQEDTEARLPEFQTLGDWEPVKSTKMDVCAKICKHYLSDDNIPDVEFNKGIPIFPRLEVPSQIMNRRILIYSESPIITRLLHNVLELYGIKSLSIDGKDDFDLRDVTVDEFHKPDNPRILIISSIGGTGLNLTICDVIILFNQPWSSQETRQIRGQAYRQPQKKVVKVIHLLAGESSDILLNQIALQKEDMFNAFVNKDLGKAFAELLGIMTGKAVCHPGDESDELSGSDDGPKSGNESETSFLLMKPHGKKRNVTSAPFKKRKNCTKKTWDACREQEESKSKPKRKSKSMTKVKSKLRDTTDTDFEDKNKVEGNRVQVEGGDPSMKRNEAVLDTDGPMMDSNGNSPEHFDTDMRSASPQILNTGEKESLGWKGNPSIGPQLNILGSVILTGFISSLQLYFLAWQRINSCRTRVNLELMHTNQRRNFTMEQSAQQDLEELVYDESSPPLTSSGLSSGIHKDRYSGTKIATPSTSSQKAGVRLSQPKFKSNPFSRSSGNLEKQKKDCQTEGTVTAEGYSSGSQYKTGGESSNETIPAHRRGTVLGSNERRFQPNPSLLKHKFEVKHRQKK
ncbi:P-loop containing nucleoside triphosphate hydrolase protein [Hysterangium stoloniferum]|nr:P-loop containing nucleoside triphosphate hydrolase protein [Hysterangium stoloniferum]